MQQTQNYKLNKPETSDLFTPIPLNENADKLDAALARMDGAAAGLDQRVQVLELRHFTVGTYAGDDTESRVIDLGFTPQAVFVFRAYSDEMPLAVTGYPAYVRPSSSSHYVAFSIVENGFQTGWIGYNARNSNYSYFAFG